jgi:excinuclease ABC subunit B
MQQAIDETQRRRKIQSEYNQQHRITPLTINKKIGQGVLERLRGKKKSSKKSKATATIKDIESLDKKIKELKIDMKIASQELRFEDAAELRDEIKTLTELRLIM